MSQGSAESTEIRRFGYYVPKPDGTMDIFVHSIVADSDVLAELNEIVGVVFKLQPIVFAFDIVEKNYSEFVNLIKEYELKLSSLNAANIAPVPIALDAMISVSQKITNFLSSTSAFFAHTDKQLQKLHGKDSVERNTWDENRKDLHAGSFAFRFLYELRNFAVHRDLPFSSLNFSGERCPEDDSMAIKMGALIAREGLLNDGYDWKKLRAQIQQQPATFDLLPLMSEYLVCLRQLCLEAAKPQIGKLILCANYFDVVIKTLNIPAGAVPVIFIGESASKGTPPSRHEVIPIEQFKYLACKLGQHRETCESQQG